MNTSQRSGRLTGFYLLWYNHTVSLLLGGEMTEKLREFVGNTKFEKCGHKFFNCMILYKIRRGLL